MLENFYLTDLEFQLRFARDFRVSSLYAGSMLRGAFGSALRSIVCINSHQECADCLTKESCAYQKIFSPVTPVNATRLSKNRDMPRGFVIKPPLTEHTYGPENPFSFRMILVGELVEWLPYIIVPFTELGRQGIGRTKTPFILERLISCGAQREETGQEVYSSKDNLVRPDKIATLGFEAFTGEDKIAANTVTLNFLTPTLLRFNPRGDKGSSQPVLVPEFHVLIKRLRDRANRLTTTYCSTELHVDYKMLGRRAETVKLASFQGSWEKRRRKTRSGEAQDMGGFVGTVTYEGNLQEFLPLLRLGEYLHVGKNAVFGNGWYRIVT